MKFCLLFFKWNMLGHPLIVDLQKMSVYQADTGVQAQRVFCHTTLLEYYSTNQSCDKVVLKLLLDLLIFGLVGLLSVHVLQLSVLVVCLEMLVSGQVWPPSTF